MIQAMSAALEHRLFVPSRTGLAPAPLVVALHGATQTARDFAAGTELDAAAERAGAYVLYPQQSLRANPLRAWNWFLPEHRARDHGEPAAILELVEEICAQHPIDRSRVFVVGLSADGAMAAILAEQAPDVFAAAGIVAGVQLHAAHNIDSAYAAMRAAAAGGGAAAARPRPARDYRRMRVSIWTGAHDNVVAPSNAHELAAQFRHLFAIDERRWTVEPGTDATIERWRDRRGEVRVELWEVHAMGHAWSGGSYHGSHTYPPGPQTADELLRFFLPEATHATRNRAS
jgi:poly(hydroxyalkanoate) depolymerase family esterase